MEYGTIIRGIGKNGADLDIQPFLKYLTLYAVILLLGSMIFFVAVIVPLAVKILDRKSGAKFLRASFPKYYRWGAGITLVALPGTFSSGPYKMTLLLLILAGFIYTREVLVDQINDCSDRIQSGEQGAAKQYDRLHRFSVLIHSLQMIGLFGLSMQLLKKM